MPFTQPQPGIAGRFVEQVRHRPEETALVFRHARVSYRELYRRAAIAQGEVRRLGLAPGAPVAVLGGTSPDAIALILALLALGRPVLLPPVGLAGPALAALVEAVGCAAVLSTDPEPPSGVRHVITPRADEPGALRVVPAPGSVGFMLTTSGSTGRPKIVPLPGAAVDRFTGWAAGRFAIRPHRTVLSYAPLNFDISLLDIWTTLTAGGRVVLVEAEHATRAGYLADLITRQRVQVIQAVPMVYQLLLEHGRDLPSVTHAICTGDSLRPHCLAGLPALFPNARLYNLYGCTETNDSFLHEIDPATDRAPLPIGSPIDGVDALLLDADGDVLSGPGVGELLVSTPFQTSGYLGVASGAFVAHPAGTGSRRYFRSGDLVRRHPDGSLTLDGRADFQVKVRGVRVNTQAVERALLEHADVAEAVVFPVPDPVAGSALHAVIHRGATRTLHTLAVRAHLAGRLPHAAIPTGIRLVDEPLPTTSTGKPDRALIKQNYLERQR